ncbi:hypothetical protein MATL_G00074560 [Megalops atlanticus]|uniref:Uncharacterized protein n=1 Tax=Megalops atlanticus TaxID=7932 RepID=A0A9D3Q646_MEGAT|nr:hypothetical protein MATL_G00074560 [Megalops atlanticus]
MYNMQNTGYVYRLLHLLYQILMLNGKCRRVNEQRVTICVFLHYMTSCDHSLLLKVSSHSKTWLVLFSKEETGPPVTGVLSGQSFGEEKERERYRSEHFLMQTVGCYSSKRNPVTW